MSKIVIVEDHELTCKLYQDLLGKHLNHTVIILHHANNLEDILLQEKPDLVIMDLTLGKVSGVDVMAELNATGQFSHIPFLAVSSHLKIDLSHKVIEAGFADYIEKPIMIDTFVQKISSLLEKK